MHPVRSLKSLLAVAVAVAAALTMALAMSSALAASSSVRKPVILDSQNGISDGQSGTILQTAPLSRQPIVEAQPIATPTELTPNSAMPFVIAPYIQLPVGGGVAPQLQLRPAPRSQ